MYRYLALALILGLIATVGVTPTRAGESPVVQAMFIETGFGHTCAVITDGSVQCWGDNGAGHLGDGTEMDSPVPVHVAGLDEPIDLVSLSDGHTCALSELGDVSCWGYNGEGQLGDGTGEDSFVPVQVDGLESGVVDLASGELHTCAVFDAGEVRCWGYNATGQLGDGGTDDALSPVVALGLDNAVQIDGGEDDFTCAVTTGGSAKCWGNNSAGHVGDGTTEERHSPVQVSGLSSGVDAVSAGGNHACALMNDRTVRCWSENFQGQLGNGTMDAGSLVPVEVNDIEDVVEITTGAFHSCALTLAQRVYCWGENTHGQLGDGTNFNRDEPVLVEILTDVVHIAGGYYHTCAVREDGSVWCWGSNQSGQLGDGTFDPSNVPIEVTLAKPAGEKRTWGDDDCDGDVESVDSLKNLRFVAALSVSQRKGCPAFASAVDVAGASPHLWGDVDCDEDVDSVDALKVLRHVAALAVVQPKGCPELGSSVTVSAPP